MRFGVPLNFALPDNTPCRGEWMPGAAASICFVVTPLNRTLASWKNTVSVTVTPMSPVKCAPPVRRSALRTT